MTVVLGDPPQPDRVQVTGPLEVRARRFEVLYLLGLQEGEFPRPPRADPFLSDDDRREIARASGLALPVREDQLDRERYLFYVCASRAERLLVLSSRTSDEEGGPQQPSFFLEDVAQVLDLPERPYAARGLSDVVWELDEAPTRQEWERAAAAAGPRVPPAVPDGLASDELVRRLVEEFPLSAGAIEAFADCPVKWLVERRLRPNALEPERRAARARQLRARSAPARVLGAARLRGAPRGSRARTSREAERILLRRAARVPGRVPDLAGPHARAHRRAEARVRPARAICATRPTARAGFEPAELELSFGGDDEKPVSIGIDGLKLHRPDRPRGHARGPRARAGLQDAAVTAPTTARPSGPRRTASRSRSTCSPWRRSSPELEVRGGRVRPARRRATRSRAGCCSRTRRDDLGDGWTQHGLARPRRRSTRSSTRRARRSARCSTGCARGDVRPCPDVVRLERRLHRSPRSAGTRREHRADTRAARGGRRARHRPVRPRERGQRQDARAGRALRPRRRGGRRRRRPHPRDHVHREGRRRAEGASAAAVPRARASATARARPRPHGSRRSTGSARSSCAGTRSLAGIDPEYEVLDETRAARIAIDAFDRALEEFLDPDEPERLDLAAAHTPDRLRRMVTTVHAKRRSAGEERPELPETGGAAAGRRARACLRRRSTDALRRARRPQAGSSSVDGAIAKLERCRDALDEVARGRRRRPGRSSPRWG